MSIQELQQINAKQARKLTKYEKKLGDVVDAYKSLLAQKESLEGSLEALGQSTSSNEQLNVLRETLATVNKEKARRETAFTDDKKRLLDDVKVARIELKTAKQELTEQRVAYTKNISEAQSLLRAKQAEHDFEKNELNARLAEHITKENNHTECQAHIDRLTIELADVNAALVAANVRAEDAASVRLLHSEMHHMKESHSRALEFERRRCADMEARLFSTKDGGGDVVDGRTDELMDTVAVLQSDARQHANTVKEMNTRIALLETENARMQNRAAIDSKALPTVVAALTDAVVTLRGVHGMTDANIIAACGLTLPTVSTPTSTPSDNDSVHDRCQSNIAHLKNMLKTVEDTAEKLRVEHEATQNTNKRQIDELNVEVKRLRDLEATSDSRHTAAVAQLVDEHKWAIDELTREITTQRDRSLAALAETRAELRTTQTILTNTRVQSESTFDTVHQSNSSAFTIDELHRVEAEVEQLKQRERQMQRQLIDSQHEVSSSRMQNEQTVAVFKKEITALQNQLTVCNDVQYVRNVFLQYLSCHEPTAKGNMLKAIAQVLKFTPDDLKTISNSERKKSTTSSASKFFSFK